MEPQERMEKLIQHLMKHTEHKTRYALAEAAGYGKKTLSEYKTKIGGPEAAIKQLTLVFRDVLENFPFDKKLINSTRTGQAHSPDQPSALEDLQIIRAATDRLEAALKQKDKSKSGIEVAFQRTAKTVNKDTERGKGKSGKQ